MILDTHVWVFYATGARLAERGLQRIDKARRPGRLQIATVTLWEVALLAQEAPFTRPETSGHVTPRLACTMADMRTCAMR